MSPGAVQVDETGPGSSSRHPLPQPAPCVAVEAELTGTGPVRLRLGDDMLSVSAVHADGRCSLEVTTATGAGPSISGIRQAISTSA